MTVLTFILYEIGLWILALLMLPKIIYESIVHKKYRSNFWQKLGLGLPTSLSKKTPVIWIHAISLGETKAVTALSKEIKKEFPQGTFIISSATETGHQEAKKSLSFADHHIYLPFDFVFLSQKVIKKFSPDLVILCESDFWFNFLHQAKKNGASIGLVNGKISERSAHRFSKVPFFSKPLFDLFDIFCLQNTLYRDRFLGVGAFADRIKITGNLKFDNEYPWLTEEEIKIWREKLGIMSHQPVLTLGSTHDPEEDLILDVLNKEVWAKKPDLKVLLTPRHPERYSEMSKILEKKGIKWINFTEINQRSGKEQVIVMNQMGFLRMTYQLADISLVGGSFTPKVGGHNILEPGWYGKPVLFGPHMHTQVEFVNLIKDHEAGLQVNLEALAPTLLQLLDDKAKCLKMGNNAIEMINTSKGSVNRTMTALAPFLEKIKEKSSK